MGNVSDRGHLVELEIVHQLNNVRFKDLSPNLKRLINDIFGVVDKREKIKCYKCEEYIKPDILIVVKKVKAYVSIKSGSANVLHGELITTMGPFLREIGIEDKYLKTLCLYHFGDGTLDGSGKERKNYHETYNWLKKDIGIFNNAVNSNHEIIVKLIERVMFKGVREDAPAADYIYCGDAELGETISKYQVLKYLERKDFGFLENLHFGPLLIRPHAKYAHTPIKNNYYHLKMDFYWPNFKADHHYIYSRYCDQYKK